MGATVHLVAKTRDPVKSDVGLAFVPSVAPHSKMRDVFGSLMESLQCPEE
jgi:hypothetical protein